jgi:hypothetical protein
MRSIFYSALAIPAAAGDWYALKSDRDKELSACAQQYLGKITFETNTAVPWWTSSTTGTDACSHFSSGCNKVIDWQCKVMTCDAPVETSRAVLCEGAPPVPTPKPPPPPPTPAPAFPMSHACLNTSKTFSMPFCNPKLSLEARLSDLVGRLSLTDKCRLTGDGATTGDNSVPSLDIPKVCYG